MNRLRLPLLLLLLTPVPVLAWAAATDDPAGRTGRIIGAAAGCGLAQTDIDRASRKAATALRGRTRDAAELKRLRARHEAAVEAEAAQVEGFDEAACAPIGDAFLAYLKGKG